MQPNTAKIYSRPKETAKLFQISTMTLHRWCAMEGFPKPSKRGQIVLYDIAAIEQWLAGGR